MNTPKAQLLTRRSSIVVRQSLQKAISQDPSSSEAVTIEQRKKLFDSHFPSNATLAPLQKDIENPKTSPQKATRLARRSSVAITQNLVSLTHAQGDRRTSNAATTKDSSSSC